MNIKDVHTIGGGELPPSAGLASCALPEAQSAVSAESAQKGVSTRYAHTATGNAEDGGRMKNTAATKCRNPEKIPRWHARLEMRVQEREISLRVHGRKWHQSFLPYHYCRTTICAHVVRS